MADPRKTGISRITGKTVSIRHANGRDIVLVVGMFRKIGVDPEALRSARVVVGVEDDRIIGFSLLAQDAGCGPACVITHEEPGRQGIGSFVARHLLEYEPVTEIVVPAGQYRMVEFAGFERTGGAAQCAFIGKRKPVRMVRSVTAAA